VMVGESPAGFTVGPLSITADAVKGEWFRCRDGRTEVTTDFGQSRPATELSATASGPAPLHRRMCLELGQERTSAGANQEGHRQ
ncbi:MAG TPA: hypothetical protein VGW38_22440, partial [Chloroflexota bacterium]|nr:hypothetical protein [Chloroflexota bacterium]